MRWKFGPSWPDYGSGGAAAGGGSFNQPPLRAEKVNEILRKNMERRRPTFGDFKDYYREGALIADEQRVQRYYTTEKEKSTEYMEAALAYLLPTLFPTRKGTFAFLASEYDDKINGTDVVLGVRNGQKNTGAGNITFSIDATTATNPFIIQEKFQNSAKKEWISKIKYCRYDGKIWGEEKAPHFILGMSPASQDRLANSFVIKDGARISARNKDADSDFIILSEMREQLLAQLAFLGTINKKGARGEQIGRLENLLPAINSSLCDNLGIDMTSSEEERIKAFQKKYSNRRSELSHRDKTYANIIIGAQRMTSRIRGQKAIESSLIA